MRPSTLRCRSVRQAFNPGAAVADVTQMLACKAFVLGSPDDSGVNVLLLARGVSPQSGNRRHRGRIDAAFGRGHSTGCACCVGACSQTPCHWRSMTS